LQRPVLAAEAVHRDEDVVGADLQHAVDERLVHVHGDGVVAALAEGARDALAGLEADLALQRPATAGDEDLAHRMCCLRRADSNVRVVLRSSRRSASAISISRSASSSKVTPTGSER